ncbi:hypothetical protein EVAR_32979_1 [Eumeta japonica]|uniref:Uncharacterized protein n=1 Tax=Eumeta variegata TaxID=151549 RepID=A0A4C1X069_EUMVA|nr:hypothetical protein EVAR_32979_1 [Eumeta japonica]
MLWLTWLQLEVEQNRPLKYHSLSEYGHKASVVAFSTVNESSSDHQPDPLPLTCSMEGVRYPSTRLRPFTARISAAVKTPSQAIPVHETSVTI